MAYPSTYNLAKVFSMLRRQPRVIVCGDSYFAWSLSRLFLQLMTGLGVGRVTALQRGFNNSFAPTPGPIFSSFPTSLTTAYVVNQANDYEVLTGEYFGLPLGGIAVVPFDGVSAFDNNGVFAFMGTRDNVGGHNGEIFTDGDGANFKCRVLYYCPSNISDLNDRNVRIHDRQDVSGHTIVSDANFATKARKLWHLVEGDPDSSGTRGAPVAGQINALDQDYLVDNADSTSPSQRWMRIIDQDWTSAHQTATPNTGKYTPLVGPVAYEVDGSGVRVPGAYFQHLADSSWGFDDNWGENAVATGLAPKQFSELQLRHYLDVTTLDRNQPTLVIGGGDNENRDTANIQTGVEGWMSMFTASLDAIGIGDYAFLPIHSWRRDILAVTGADEIAINDRMGQAMYDAARSRNDAGFLSVQALLNNVYMDGGAAADAEVNRLGLNPLTFGTVSGVTTTAKNMLGDGTHPSDETSAAFFAAVIKSRLSVLGLDPAILKPGMVTHEGDLKPSLVNDTYAGGEGIPSQLKPGLTTPDGTELKPGLRDEEDLKIGLLK